MDRLSNTPPTNEIRSDEVLEFLSLLIEADSEQRTNSISNNEKETNK